MPSGGLISDKTDRNTTNEAVSFPAHIPRHARLLSDKLFVTFHHACDTEELEVAEQILNILEVTLIKPRTTYQGGRRRNIEGLVAAFERLWHLRHPER